MSNTSLTEELVQQPLIKRLRMYMRLTGPGYMQSAMTLGSGSVASCVVMGSLLSYELLWVQPLAIMLGYIVLAAVGKQTTCTGERPYKAFWERLHPVFALLWGISALIATIIWHFPQYSLAGNGLSSLAEGIGLHIEGAVVQVGPAPVPLGRLGIGCVLLAAACAVVYLYSAGARGLRLYELAVKVLVWMIVGAFGIVVLASGIDWGRFFLGATGISFARRVIAEGGIPPETIKPIVAGMAAAVGINMVFLYPYSLLSKKWGKEYRELAYFDLFTGMVLPFLIATTLMIVATANTIGPAAGEGLGTAVKDIREVAPVLSKTFGSGFSLALIGVGMVAVGFSSIITHMLACGFIGCEVFGFDHESKARWWFSLMPIIGMLGVVFPFPWSMAITASTLAYPFMPVAVICFMVLLNRRDYMGDERPAGVRALVWNGLLMLAIAVMVVAAAIGLHANWAELKDKLIPEAAAGETGTEDEISAASISFTHKAMGTDFTITLFGRPGDATVEPLRRIAGEAFAAIDDLESRVSARRPGNQVSAVNCEAGRQPVRVAPDVLEMVLFADRLWEETVGAFDITVGPLLDAWGFYRVEGRLPSKEERTANLEKVGMDKVRIDEKGRTIELMEPGMRLDFGGIAKGLALDEAARILRRYNITSALLDGGTSTVVAIGAPPGKQGWEVAIRHPLEPGETITTLALCGNSSSTSGTAVHAFVLDGRRYGHIIDPRTGMPVEDMLSATAVASTGMESDALSTAFFVMGPGAVRTFCEEHPGVGALLVYRNEQEEAVIERISLP